MWTRSLITCQLENQLTVDREEYFLEQMDDPKFMKGYDSVRALLPSWWKDREMNGGKAIDARDGFSFGWELRGFMAETKTIMEMEPLLYGKADLYQVGRYNAWEDLISHLTKILAKTSRGRQRNMVWHTKDLHKLVELLKPEASAYPDAIVNLYTADRQSPHPMMPIREESGYDLEGNRTDRDRQTKWLCPDPEAKPQRLHSFYQSLKMTADHFDSFEVLWQFARGQEDATDRVLVSIDDFEICFEPLLEEDDPNAL